MYFRTIIISISILMFLWNCTTSSSGGNNAMIKFEQDNHDFGEIAFNANCEYSFKYTIQGDVPIVIQNVETSCGCTVPDWSKKPLKPGKSDVLKITYDTSQPGAFRKTITVHYNGEDSPVKLTISGNVSNPEKDDNTGSENNSVASKSH